MRTTWHSLAWKEWHEHKWKLVAIFAALCGVSSLAILFEESVDRFGLAVGGLFLCSVPMAVFVGLGSAANERSRGTFPFLQSLPMPLWQTAVVKLVAGFLTVAIAIVLTTMSFFLWKATLDAFGIRHDAPSAEENFGPFNTGNWYVDMAIACLMVGTSLFTWTAAAGVNCKDEVRAAVVALAIMIGWSSLMIFLVSNLQHLSGLAARMRIVLLAATPGGVFAEMDLQQNPSLMPLFLFVFITTHALLAVSYVLRFGRVTNHAVGSTRKTLHGNSPGEWLGAPRKSALESIGWKQLRESGPIAVLGLVAILGICVPAFLSSEFQSRFADIYIAVSISVGFAIALIAGIGVALHDCEPRLNSFWRSRPINADLWFGVKFLTGLAIVLATIYLPLLIIDGGTEASAPNPYRSPLMPLLHVALFAAAVAATCLVRHAIYGAILSIGMLVACMSAASLALKVAAWIGWADPFQTAPSVINNPEIVRFSAVICIFLSTLMAWLAMRNDWGLKSRY